ncbi:MAG TPA: hypothetical protein VLF69_05580 [Candidatus Saccharimonadales bacterium]|nr:hypothetical protein [Candidatus Saccharimonadales bacterium]
MSEQVNCSWDDWKTAVAVANTERFIETGDFYAPNHTALRDMFTAMGRADRWSDDPTDPAFLQYLRQGLIGVEHGDRAKKDKFTPEEFAAALPYFRQFGLVDEKLPPDGAVFDHAFVAGGTTTALYRRIGTEETAVREHGVQIGEVNIAVGQRPREERDGTDEELLSTGGRLAGFDITADSWVQKSQKDGRWGEDNQWGLTETEQARIALGKRVAGALQPRRINLQLTDLQNPHDTLQPVFPGVPSRLVTSYEYTTPDGRAFKIMNAPAVERRQGDARPDTKSTAAEWLATCDVRPGARVLFVTSNPHADRMTRDFLLTLQQLGRGDIQVTVAATSASETATMQLYLGEIARMIDKDVRTNYKAELAAREQYERELAITSLEGTLAGQLSSMQHLYADRRLRGPAYDDLLARYESNRAELTRLQELQRPPEEPPVIQQDDQPTVEAPQIPAEGRRRRLISDWLGRVLSGRVRRSS